jgi:hypothetical protein
MDWVVAVPPNRLGSEDTESQPIPEPVPRRMDRWPASRDPSNGFPPGPWTRSPLDAAQVHGPATHLDPQHRQADNLAVAPGLVAQHRATHEAQRGLPLGLVRGDRLWPLLSPRQSRTRRATLRPQQRGVPEILTRERVVLGQGVGTVRP